MTETESGIGKLLDLARGDRKYLANLDKLRRKIVVMFTDIQGSTAYFEKHGDSAGLLMVHQCNDTLREIVDGHGGRVIKTIGDGMLATFEDCGRSVEAGIKMQHGLREISQSQPEAERVAIRIGIHYDTGIVRSHDVFGDVVNVASRIESVAQPRQIVISETLYEKVLDLGFQARKIGRFLLKGKKSERTLYEILWNPSQPEGSGEARAAQRTATGRVLPPSGDRHAWCSQSRARHCGRPYRLAARKVISNFRKDRGLAPLNARVFVDDGQLFIKDLSAGADNIFLRVSGGYTLQSQDIILMGRQEFQFREISGAMSVAAGMGIALAEVSRTLAEPVAELHRLHPKGSVPARFPAFS